MGTPFLFWKYPLANVVISSGFGNDTGCPNYTICRVSFFGNNNFFQCWKSIFKLCSIPTRVTNSINKHFCDVYSLS
ncbi:unnamed protein product [Chondrus crispus]|uniref:Uncharacterized protein n=1 Tax=Chondrus crispus TaxID=2769 RepID=R7Q8R4_CHOCR|nr:unnamed protein product [Chondrus crispus]CDF33781.1 unnamed protein product [Chondrus crispus]|eukprot:XP_005713600.1 unnamed protein product [Chondrus crispus]